mgnify:CR=1 FL=1
MRFLLSLIFIFFFGNLFATDDWGQTGHRTTAEVASKHLTKKAKKEINKLLNGKSLALISTYADEIKSERTFDKYRPWHYVNITFDKTYTEIEPNPEGDIIQAIKFCIKILKDNKTTEVEKAFHLKLLVHFMGDLHQPLHLGLEEDKGANDFQVRWFNDGTNLHAVWDSKMIDQFQMSYTELSDNLPAISNHEIAKLQEGSVLEWAEEMRVLTKEVYNSASVGDKLGYRYMYDNFNTVRKQLQIGGIRLAKVLNEIFG